MTFSQQVDENSSEHIEPGSDGFGDWLSIDEAVSYSVSEGLNRTQKTIRKWASRAYRDQEAADLQVRREDIANGFRWLIERSSLERKIKEELEFVAKKTHGEPVRTGADKFEQVRTGSGKQTLALEDANPSERVTTGEHPSGSKDAVVDDEFLKDQIEEKDRQIAQLNKQLERRDDQIMTMLERDRETNILISGLQQTLTNSLGLESPFPRDHRNATKGDNRIEQDSQNAVE